MSRMKENKGEKIEFEMLFCPIVYEYEKIKWYQEMHEIGIT